MSMMLYDVLVDIERLVPARRMPRSRTRHTRSWLPFFGSALKTVTGTATTDDVAKVQKAVEDIRRRPLLHTISGRKQKPTWLV